MLWNNILIELNCDLSVIFYVWMNNGKKSEMGVSHLQSGQLYL